MRKVISSIITIILIAWVALMGYDYYRASKKDPEPPLIILKEEKRDYSDGTVTEYTSLGYKYIVYRRTSRTGFMFGGFWLTA